MTKRILRRTGFVLVAGLLLASALMARGQGEGIFAEFNTSMGSFTCRLEYASSPKAVANFIGLATGQQPWLDQTKGVVRTDKFYDGLIFHRVIPGFVIQSGSPNGQGTDGPGYQFLDEFTNSLRYASAGVLGMANSGTNSNGAQFFITVSPQPSLNDHYTIFGEVIGGTNVVLDITRVGTDFNDRPTNNIMLQSVVIRTNGAAAEAFANSSQGLPLVTSQRLDIANFSSNRVALTFSNRIYVENFLFSSLNYYVPATYTNVYVTTNYFVTNTTYVTTNLTNVVIVATNVVHRTNVYTYATNTIPTNYWVTNIPLISLYATNVYDTNLALWGSQSLGVEVPNSPMTNTVFRGIDKSSSVYYRLAQVVYAPIYVPRTLNNRTLTLIFDDYLGLGTIVINFDGANGGTYVPPPTSPPGTVMSYSWFQTYAEGDLDPINYSPGVLPMSLSFFFSSPSTGTFNGTVNSTASYNVTGTFTLN
jgi:cyclophilin family peptidyl-prolyl cis-trans isomerase